jgi:hypothetical protein
MRRTLAVRLERLESASRERVIDDEKLFRRAWLAQRARTIARVFKLPEPAEVQFLSELSPDVIRGIQRPVPIKSTPRWADRFREKMTAAKAARVAPSHPTVNLERVLAELRALVP